MKIVVIGAGEVGFQLSKGLSEEDFDITIIEISKERVIVLTFWKMIWAFHKQKYHKSNFSDFLENYLGISQTKK